MRVQTLTSLALIAVGLVAAGGGWLLRDRRRALLAPAAAATTLALLGVLAASRPEFGNGTPGWSVLWVVALGLLAVGGGGPVTTAVFSLVDGSHEADDDSVRSAGAVLRGGAWIGALERAAVYGTLVAGWPEGVALVLGLKGLGRYPELRNQEHTGTAERFIIGTFTSVLWAVGCAAVAHLLRS